MTLFTGYNASDIYVIAGDHNIDIADGEEKYNAKQVIIHPKYGENDGYHFNYDACLLEVDPISLDGKTKGTVCLPESGAHIGATIDESGNKVRSKTIFNASTSLDMRGGRDKRPPDFQNSFEKNFNFL